MASFRLLAGLTGAARLSYNVLRDLPTIPTLRTFAQTADGLNALEGAARLSYNSLRDVPAQQSGAFSPSLTLGTWTKGNDAAVAGRYNTSATVVNVSKTDQRQ